MTTYFKAFEIWQSPNSASVCPAGPAGGACRATNERDAKMVHAFCAWSELDMMQRYYDYMDFGIYNSSWPDLAVLPYFYTEALANMKNLKKPLKPLREFFVMGDGATLPPVPSPIARILVQERAVFGVNVWISDTYGGIGEPPLNEMELMVQADALVREKMPHILKLSHSTSLICPLELAEQMTWRPYGATTLGTTE